MGALGIPGRCIQQSVRNKNEGGHDCLPEDKGQVCRGGTRNDPEVPVGVELRARNAAVDRVDRSSRQRREREARIERRNDFS